MKYKNVREDIIRGIVSGDGWGKPRKLTKKQKKALDEARRRTANSVCPFDFSDLGPNEPLRDQHGRLLNEEISVTIPKAALKEE